MELTPDKYLLIFLAIFAVVLLLYFLIKTLFILLLKAAHSRLEKSEGNSLAGRMVISDGISEYQTENENSLNRERREKRTAERRSGERRLFNRGFFLRKGYFDERFPDKLGHEEEFCDRRDVNNIKSDRRKSERRNSQ